MTISLPGSNKRGFAGLLGRKKTEAPNARKTDKPLKRHEIAKLFSEGKKVPKVVKPAKLNDAEKQDQVRISSLRGALYSEE